MHKYVIFINNSKAKAVPKENITDDLTKKMKEKGFKKYHIEVVAENEKDAIIKLNKENDNYLSALGDFSYNILICAIVIIIVSLVYFFKQ